MYPQKTLSGILGLASIFALLTLNAFSEDQTLTLFPLNFEVFDLTPLQQTVEKTFQVEPNSDVDILILSASLTLDLALIDPGNNVYPHGTDTQFVTASYTYPERSQATSGLTYLFHLNSAPPGAWKCRIRETVALSGPRGVAFQVSSSSPIRTGLLGGGDTYVAGTPITLSVVTVNGEAVLKTPEVTAVSGSIVKVGDATFTPLPLTFLDNGVGQDGTANDGIFTVSPSLGPGEYSLFGLVNGTTSANQPFNRNFSGRFTVIQDSASYSGNFREQVSDLNGNGQPDTLEIIPSFNVNATGDYFTVVVLQGSDGKDVNQRGRATLSPGLGREISVPFDITSLRLLRSDGPWQVKLIQLEKLDDPGSGYLVHRENAGTTSDHRLKDFERKGLFLVGTPSVLALDDDSNGLYNRLQVSIPVEVATSDKYRWSLSLYDNADIFDMSAQTIERTSGNGFLEATEAPAVITVSFDGSKIGHHGLNGPYSVGSLAVEGMYDKLQQGEIVTTAAFSFSQFEGATSAGAPSVSLAPASLTFAGQNVGTTSPSQNVTLTNTGNAALAITNVAVTGDFAQSNNCGNSVAVGQNCILAVTFTPTATGARPGSLTLTDNASNSPQAIPLSGTGIAPAVLLSPSSLTFARQNVGSTSVPQLLTLRNTGSAPLLLTNILARGDFAQTNNCGNSLAAGASCSLNVTFTPTATGPRQGAIGFTDDASNSPQRANLAGVGVAPAALNPVFEGWYKNSNGSFTLSFGYQNLNNGTVQIPVGPNNFFTPRPPDRGQTTLFQMGRQTRAFNVVVPASFNSELVWTLTFEGFKKTATGSLNPTQHIRP
ncbi:MAG: choice-of-anchor D domain-containing protein [Terriglobia bacterium]